MYYGPNPNQNSSQPDPLDPYQNYQFNNPNNQVQQAYQADLQRREFKNLQNQRKNRPRPSFGARFRSFLLSLLLILVLICLSLFPIGNQSVLARSLDAIGQHEAALVVDNFSKSMFQFFQGPTKPDTDQSRLGNFILGYENIDINNPESCRNLWNLTNFSLDQFSEISGQSYFEAKPIAQAYQENFNLQGSLGYNLSLPKAQLALQTNGSFKMDTDKLAELSNQGDFKEPVGVIEGKFGLGGSSNLDLAYLAIDPVSLISDQMISNFNLILANETSYTESEKIAIRLIMEGVREYLQVQAKDLLSQTTGELLMEQSCRNIVSIKVEAPRSKTFGQGENQVEREIRPILIDNKDILSQDDFANQAKVFFSILEDQNFRNYLKSKYPSYLKIIEGYKTLSQHSSPEDKNTELEDFQQDLENDLNTQALENNLPDIIPFSKNLATLRDQILCQQSPCLENQKEENPFIFNSTEDLVSQQDYEKQVDKVFNNIISLAKTEEDFSQQLATIQTNNQDNFRQETTTQIFIDMESQKVFGSEMNISLIFTPKYLEEQKEFAEIVKEGVTFLIQNHSQNYLNEVETITVPDSVR